MDVFPWMGMANEKVVPRAYMWLLAIHERCEPAPSSSLLPWPRPSSEHKCRYLLTSTHVVTMLSGKLFVLSSFHHDRARQIRCLNQDKSIWLNTIVKAYQSSLVTVTKPESRSPLTLDTINRVKSSSVVIIFRFLWSRALLL